MIHYQVFFRQPELHYIEVEMTIPVIQTGTVELYMPVWTPGSYMIREFSRNIDQVVAKGVDFEKIDIQKDSKNSWTFFAKDKGDYHISYRVYANEISVRTNHVDVEHATLNGAPTFLAVKGLENLSHKITYHPFEKWKVISSSLPEADGPWVRIAENYDLLVDSPAEIGNQEVLTFEAGGIPHELAFVGPSNADKKKLAEELKLIIEEEVRFFGKKHPCDRYVFILHHTEDVYGGLEHLHNSVNMVPRWNYDTRDKYLQTISLLAHEYFHLWNVKRIRPEELGPFDYSQENYTRQLWAIEGVTSFYDDYFVYLAGVSDQKEYLKIVAENINKVENTPGDRSQSLTESSFDTWIKYYRQHENTHNNQVNYYVKGATIVTALNLLILKQTQGAKSMDDVMRALYELYLRRPEKGYSEKEILAITELIAGTSLEDFFDRHIYGTEPIDYAKYLSEAGLELVNTSDEKYDTGWYLNVKDSKFFVSKIDVGSGAAVAGINANDEILALNGFRMNAQWKNSLFGKTAGDIVEVIISRAGRIHVFHMELLPNQKKSYTIQLLQNPTESQLKVREAWLKKG